MRHLLLLLCGTILFSCGDLDSIDKIDNLNKGKIDVIGHGGNGFLSVVDPFNPLPPNSSTSISEALKIENLDGLELDLQLSADSILILFHDHHIEGSTAMEGYINDFHSRDILGKKYEVGFYDLFQNETIISLDSALHLITTSGKMPQIYFDSKLASAQADKIDLNLKKLFCEKLIQALDQNNFPQENALLISPELETLAVMQSFNVNIKLVLDQPQLSLATAKEMQSKGIYGVSMNVQKPSAKEIKLFQENGIRVILFGGKSRKGLIEYMGKMPDAIQTNHPARLAKLSSEINNRR